jgi:hypothetical protein
MNITICVAAYQAPRVLSAAVRAYRAMGWDVLVHLDAKVDLDAYRAEIDAAFIEPRIPIFWGGMSQVDAQFLLFDAALAAGADRIVYVTDNTLPIRPLREIDAALREPIDRIHISCPKPGTDHALRYETFAIYDHIATNPRGNPSRVLDAAFFDLAREADGLRLMGKKPLRVYWGLAYRVFTRETIQRIMGICRNDPHLWASFKFSQIPEETMIPSVIGNYLPDLIHADNPVFMDFTQGRGPLVYDRLPVAPPHCLFARKFAPENCEAIVDGLL